MNSPDTKHNTRHLMLLFMFIYFTSYVTRINYVAVIAEIVKQEGFLKSTASIALTASAITYGLGQLLSGYIGDKMQPKKIIFAGLILTISMNIAIPFCTSPYQMTVAWGVNGLAQAFMWPPLVKIMSNVFSEEDYRKAVVLVSWGSNLGTIAIYLTAPLLISLGGWRLVFIVSASFAAIMAMIWMVKCPLITLDKGTKEESGTQPPFPWSFMLVGILVAIVLQGYLRDGVATWIPSLVSETFGLSTNISILTGIVIPVFSIIIYYVVSNIHRKVIHNELVLAGLAFCVGTVSAFILALFRDVNTALTVAMSSLLTGSMHGVNLMLICMVPSRYAKFGRISMISGLFNSFTYLGSAISAYGMAAYIERFGWNSMAFSLTGIALVGALICFALAPRWSKF